MSQEHGCQGHLRPRQGDCEVGGERQLRSEVSVFRETGKPSSKESKLCSPAYEHKHRIELETVSLRY